jgi:AcrR family transcriptional regulator
MMLVAERLFAERGIGEVSLREIGAVAGQRNNGAAQYHFGTKQGLVEAIVAWRMAPLNARRLEILATFDEGGRGDDPRALVEALLAPFVESLATPGTHWARFLAQAMHETGLGLPVGLDRPETRGLADLVQRLGRVLAHVPPALRDERLTLVGTLVVSAVASWERRAEAAGRAAPPLAPLAANLVDAAVAVLEAPVSGATRRALRQRRRAQRPRA